LSTNLYLRDLSHELLKFLITESIAGLEKPPTPSDVSV